MYALALATGGMLGQPQSAPLAAATFGKLFIGSVEPSPSPPGGGGKYSTLYKDITIESQIRLDEQDLLDLTTILVRSGILDE